MDELFDYLRSEACTLKHLDLAYNDLPPNLLLGLVQALPHAKSLQHLDIQDNIMGLNTAIELGKVLIMVPSL